MSTEPEIYRLRGYLGILAKKLKVSVQLDMQERLTLQMATWGDAPPVDVQAFYTQDGYFWLPRFFFNDAIKNRKVGKNDISFEWTNGDPVELPLNVTLDPKRGQPAAVTSMVAHLKEHSGGILVAPTGCGKTILGLSIGHALNTHIGVLVYNSHMVKNWIETAEWLFGLKKEDIGLVQGERCDLGKPVTIMMVQSLLSERPYPPELYDQFGIIVADEVNRFGAPQWNEVMKQFSARYRVGLSADPTRDDGLDKLVQWHFGDIAHKIVMATPKPHVIQVRFRRTYKQHQYMHKWQRTPRGDPMPDSLRYDKCLMADKERNEFLIGEMVKMRTVGRRIMVFSRLKDHLKLLKEMFESRWNVLDRIVLAIDGETDDSEFFAEETKVTLLVGGLEKNKRDKGKLAAAMAGDIIFTTFAFARDALNIPHIDTLVFATPPGKPLQPIGRLRDKGPADRRPLMAIDPFEEVPYSIRKADRRQQTYWELGSEVTRIDRTPPSG